MVIWDISLLIVPSTQILVTYSATHLNHLYENVNEGWNSTISLYDTCSQLDYSIGFGCFMFTEEHFKKFESFVSKIKFKL